MTFDDFIRQCAEDCVNGGSEGATQAGTPPEVPASQECPKAQGSYPWRHGPAQEKHVCPYVADVHDDRTTLCDCCERCTQECRWDI